MGQFKPANSNKRIIFGAAAFFFSCSVLFAQNLPQETKATDGVQFLSEFNSALEQLVLERDGNAKRTQSIFTEHHGKLCEKLVAKLNETLLAETKAGSFDKAVEIQKTVESFEKDDRSTLEAIEGHPRKLSSKDASSFLKMFRKAERDLIKKRESKIKSDEKRLVENYEQLKNREVIKLEHKLAEESAAGNLEEAVSVKNTIDTLRKLKAKDAMASWPIATEKVAVGAATGAVDALGVRTGDQRKVALLEHGGTDDSEKAVELGLSWIVQHQLPDGGWNFDHRMGPGKFRDSPNPGELTEARLGATALALLPFLGRGQTHQFGEHKDNVRAGLNFLMNNAKKTGNGISFFEKGGTMYSHGLCSIVFCEAYAMSRDPELKPFAQGCISFIEEAQDPATGGWRYQPRQSGDTSVGGWQLMAIKTAELSDLKISEPTLKKIDKFLTNVSNANGSLYGYLDAPSGQSRISYSCTSIGLLCRIYMGWKKDTPGLIEGGKYLSDKGPSNDDVYYNYYATQLMKQYGGQDWDKWNTKMRDYLVREQSRKGNAAGSWCLGEKNHSSKRGGRLYETAMAIMTLEVYYRHPQIY